MDAMDMVMEVAHITVDMVDTVITVAIMEAQSTLAHLHQVNVTTTEDMVDMAHTMEDTATAAPQAVAQDTGIAAAALAVLISTLMTSTITAVKEVTQEEADTPGEDIEAKDMEEEEEESADSERDTDMVRSVEATVATVVATVVTVVATVAKASNASASQSRNTVDTLVVMLVASGEHIPTPFQDENSKIFNSN
jgi:hypothetical protein